MDSENQLQTTEQVSPLAHAASLMAANSDLDVTKLKELLELQERYEAIQAKKAYSAAMTAFKANPPEIIKDKTVSYGQTSYNHASLGNVTSCINVALSKHGLSASWLTGQSEGGIQVTCRISHIHGHSESTSLSAPPDDSGKKNKIQQISSTITYLERYTLLALTGLATYEGDDDANAAEKPPQGPPKPTGKQIAAIQAIAADLQESAPPDMTISVKELTALLYSSKGCYPDEKTVVGDVVAWIITNGKTGQIMVPTKKEKQEEAPGKAQFKYQCNNDECGIRFPVDEAKGTKDKPLCKMCGSDNIERAVD